MAMYLGDQKVRITDKSKTNLLDVFNRTEGKLTSGSSNTSVRPEFFDETKYFVGLSATNYYYPINIKSFDFISNIGVSGVSSKDAYGIAFPVKCKPNTDYTLSATLTTNRENTQYLLGIGFYKEDGTFLSSGLNRNGNNYVYRRSPEDAAFLIAVLAPGKNLIPTLFTNICLVEGFFNGTTFTGYEPYNNKLQPPMIRANNLIPYPWSETRQEYTDSKGITYKVNPDKSITVNGTCTQTSTFGIIAFAKNKPLKAGTYFLSGTPENAKGATMNSQISVQYVDANNATIGKHDRGDGVCFTLDRDVDKFACFLAIVAGTYNNVTFKPMLNYGNVPLPFRPYSEEPEYIY